MHLQQSLGAEVTRWSQPPQPRGSRGDAVKTQLPILIQQKRFQVRVGVLRGLELLTAQAMQPCDGRGCRLPRGTGWD